MLSKLSLNFILERSLNLLKFLKQGFNGLKHQNIFIGTHMSLVDKWFMEANYHKVILRFSFLF